MLKDAQNRLTEDDIRKKLNYKKNRFIKTLNKEQQINFKVICCWYKKLIEYTNLKAFDAGAFSALTANAEEDYKNFIKEQELSK